MAPPSPSDEDEHRIYPRVSASGRALVRRLGEGRTQEAAIIDVSRSGILLATSPVQIGTRVRTEFLGMEANGTVVRQVADVSATHSPGIAVHFDEIQELDWERMRSRRRS